MPFSWARAMSSLWARHGSCSKKGSAWFLNKDMSCSWTTATPCVWAHHCLGFEERQCPPGYKAAVFRFWAKATSCVWASWTTATSCVWAASASRFWTTAVSSCGIQSNSLLFLNKSNVMSSSNDFLLRSKTLFLVQKARHCSFREELLFRNKTLPRLKQHRILAYTCVDMFSRSWTHM